MKPRNILILIGVSLAMVAATVPPAQAQDASTSQLSLAEASKRAKEQQKSEPKTAKVYTDDDLENLKGQISIVGTEPAPPAADADAAAAKPEPASNASAKGAQDEAYWRNKFAAARRTLADNSKELDILQREFNLKQVQYYANPNEALQQQHSREDLNDTQAEITAKKQDVDKDNQAISDLQDELRTSGGEPGWANEPSSNAQSDKDSFSAPQSSQADQDQDCAGPAPDEPDSQQSDSQKTDHPVAPPLSLPQ
jgi:chromosome segregation ATPase